MRSKEEIIFLHTVGDLKKYLIGIPEDTKLVSFGPDLGGYEVVSHAFVNPVHKDGYLILGHKEHWAWKNSNRMYKLYFDNDDAS